MLSEKQFDENTQYCLLYAKGKKESKIIRHRNAIKTPTKDLRMKINYRNKNAIKTIYFIWHAIRLYIYNEPHHKIIKHNIRINTKSWEYIFFRIIIQNFCGNLSINPLTFGDSW